MKKFIIAADTLKKALSKLGQAVASKPTLPILGNILVKVNKDEVILITTDLELTILYTCTCESQGSFEMLIPFDFLNRIMGMSKNQPMSIELKGKMATITGEYDEYEIGSLDKVADFPDLPTIPKKNFISINGAFVTVLGRSMMTVSKEELRPAMQKTCLDITDKGMTMVSTDAYTLFTHAFEVTSTAPDQLLISPKIAKALEGFSTTEIHWHTKHIAFKTEGIVVIATRHEDKYPDYKVVIPSYDGNLLLDRQHLIDALRRCCLSTNTTRETKIILKKSGGTIHFEAVDIDLNRKIQADISGVYEGEVESISVNARKLLTLMEQVDYEKVHLAIHSPGKPVLIRSENDKDYLGLIIPLFTSSE